MKTNAATRLVAESLTDKASNFRTLLKQKQIRVRVRVAPGGGQVQVIAPSYAEPFTDEQKKIINQIAIDLGYTGVRGQPIRVAGGDPHQLNFWPGQGTHARASAEVQALTDHQTLKRIENEFVKELKKNGIHGVDVSFVRDDMLNIHTEDAHAFEKTKQVLKKVPNLHFDDEEVDREDPEAPQYFAWYKF